jgi:hypothetical protein
MVTRSEALSSPAAAASSASAPADGDRPPDGGHRLVRRGRLEQDVARDHQDRDPPAAHRGAHRDPHEPRQLLGGAHELGVDAALPEELLRVRLLEVPAADLRARDLGGDHQDGDAAPAGVEQPVDQVGVAGPAAGGAHGELPGQGRLGRRREGGGLLVPYVQPLDAAVAAQRVGKAVQRVARQPVDAADAARLEVGDDQVGDGAHYRVRRSVTL